MYSKSDLINLTEKIYELSTLADNIGFRLDNEIEQLLSIVQDEIVELEDHEAYENDMLMRQWDDIEDYYNA